jgi:hypothetical protein
MTGRGRCLRRRSRRTSSPNVEAFAGEVDEQGRRLVVRSGYQAPLVCLVGTAGPIIGSAEAAPPALILKRGGRSGEEPIRVTGVQVGSSTRPTFQPADEGEYSVGVNK